ncbi:MAG: hypothetical protein F6K26_44815 [Moorea sp. SIO2I5]|nr:hypothetical protein [Moorena sp. SIO2I5]
MAEAIAITLARARIYDFAYFTNDLGLLYNQSLEVGNEILTAKTASIPNTTRWRLL